METLFHSTVVSGHINRTQPSSLLAKFMNWCKGQEKNRIGWLGGILTFHGCVFTPITLFAIILSGTYFPFYITALVAMGVAVVTNLAAMPTRITIPVFLLSLVIDLAIIIACIINGFNIASTQI